MNYRPDKLGQPVSVLGFGCMRFPRSKGKINMSATERLVHQAIDLGINYFDTAYIYPGSEAALGEILEKLGCREEVRIATKLPHYLIKSQGNLETCFAEQLRRLRTDHVDYYLMHMLTDVGTWERLKALGIEDWLAEKRSSGAIGQIGFSYHGNTGMFCQLVDAYPWDFCQIQYNYLDEHTQAGRQGLHYASQKGLPVIIMEPLRGGRLVDRLPAGAKQAFANHPEKQTPAQWGLRWLWDQPEVTCVLSGMRTVNMLLENVKTACHTVPGQLGQRELDMYRQAVISINEGLRVGCTGCGYCMPCPKNVDIPGTFSAYNRYHTDGKFIGLKEYAMCTTLRRIPTSASNCVGCGKCETHCPQGLEIRRHLKDARKTLEGPLHRLACKLSRKLVPF